MTVGNWDRDENIYEINPLDQLYKIRQKQALLRRDYHHWMKKSVEKGYSNTKIAKHLKISETAVRLYRQRNDL